MRKRVIKLLKTFYNITEAREKKVDICIRMVLRMLDEDDTVRDAAVKTMEELWFPEAASQKASSDLDKSQLTAKVSIVMGVSAHFKDRQSPLEDLLHTAMSEKEASGAATLHRRYGEICETLIDGLVDASDLPEFVRNSSYVLYIAESVPKTVVNCVRTIYLFTAAYPAVLSVQQASTLLPYLKNATSVSRLLILSFDVNYVEYQLEEQTTSDYLLRIFRSAIPHLPKTALKFGQELQTALQPMILKPSSTAGVMVNRPNYLGIIYADSSDRGCKRQLHACVPLYSTSPMSTTSLLPFYGHVAVSIHTMRTVSCLRFHAHKLECSPAITDPQ